MNDSEISTKLDGIKKVTPLILATILDIAHRTEELARLHATLKGNNTSDALVSSVVGMVAVEMSGETYLLAKRVEIKSAMETLAKQTSAFWNDVEAISGNAHLGKVSPRDAPMPAIDFGSLLQQMNPPAAATVPGSMAISGVGSGGVGGGGGAGAGAGTGGFPRADRPRVVTRPPEAKPAGDSNAA